MKKLFYFMAAAMFAAVSMTACEETPEDKKPGTLTDDVPTSVQVSPTTLSFVAGDTTPKALSATVFPEDLPEESKKVSWKSDNTDVATVDDDGMVTAVGIGTTKIIVTTTTGGKKAECTVTVTQGAVAVETITLSPKTGSSVPGGYSETVTATITPSGATNKDIVWSIEEGKETIVQIEKINENDPSKIRVKGLAVGEAIITATTVDGDKTDTFTMTVSHVKPETVEIYDGTTKLTATDTFEVYTGVGGTLTATVLPATVGNKKVTWKAYSYYGSTNAQQPQVEQNVLQESYLVINAETGAINALRPSGTVPLTVVATTEALGADDNPVIATCKVVVKQTMANAIEGLPADFTIEMGEVKTIVEYNNVKVKPDGAYNNTFKVTAVAGTEGSVAIENELLVSIKGTAAGAAKVRFTATQGTGDTSDDIWVDVPVTVTAPSNIPTSVNITNPVGGTATVTWAADSQITITGNVEPAIAGQELKFESLNPTIATVTSAGKVTAVDYGTATIRVKSSVKEDVYTDVTITAKPLGDITFLNSGATYEIKNSSDVLVQTWTDAAVASAITTTGKNGNSTYAPGSNGNWLKDAVVADSSSGNGGGGTLFSWGLVTAWGDSQICPAGFSVPTGADFLTLSSAIAGAKHSAAGYTDATVVADFKTKWNHAYGGYWTTSYQPTATAGGKGTLAVYWSSETGANATANGTQMYIASPSYTYGASGIYPNSTGNNAKKNIAAQLRCVKNEQ